jgi:phage gp36-like protein
MYCTQADIEAVIPEAELIQLTDDTVPPFMVDAAKISAAIAAAGELIDGYISSRYQLPLTNCPALVKRISVDLAVYEIFMRRKKRAVPETVQKTYDNAMRLLNAIAGGKVTLGSTSAGLPAQSSAVDTVQFSAADRVFGPGSLEDY